MLIQKHAIGFFNGALAACGAVTVTNPWEVVKTRLQLHGELAPSSSTTSRSQSALKTFVRIFRTEGIHSLQKGLGPAYLYQILMNGTRLGIYDPLRESIQLTLNSFNRGDINSETNSAVPAMIIAGALAGMAGAFVASPMYLIKTSFSSVNPEGVQYKYKGIFGGLRGVYTEGGIRGLWRGVDASMMRTGVGSSVQLSAYGVSKDLLVLSGIFGVNGKEPIALHFSASLITSFFVCLAMNPFDVVSTRMYNQKTGIYKNAWDCMKVTVKGEGFGALYKGFGAHYLRVGPHTIITFLILEQARLVARKQQWIV